MSRGTRQEFVTRAGRAAVEQIAPEELPVFDALARRYAGRDNVPSDSGRYRDGPLGSGWDAPVALLSPVVLTLANVLWNKLLDRAGDAVIDRGERRLRHTWTRLRRERRAAAVPDATSPAAGDATPEALRELLTRRAAELGVPPETAGPLVEALLAELPAQPAEPA